jgi:hypothetical protein
VDVADWRDRRDTACMAMVDHFFGHRFDLKQLAGAFRAKNMASVMMSLLSIQRTS